jgi:thiamine biosynthesis protein ThiI
MHYLLRYSELGTKAAGTRRRMLHILQENLRRAFSAADITASVELGLSRGRVTGEDPGIRDILQRTFGIQSFSPVQQIRVTTLEALVEQATAYFKDAVAGKQFAVRARRIGKHDFASHDIEMALGAALFPHGSGVNLTNPEVTCGVEVRSAQAYLYSERVEGPHGLPLGSQDRALVLLSGGFDSAVAAWEVMRRGVGVDYCFFNLGGPIHEEGVLRVAKRLHDAWQHGDDASVLVVPFMQVVEMIRNSTEPPFWNLVLKQAMLAVAARIAQQRGLAALVTGDAIGQVSSQTLANLSALQDIGLPVLRPLLTSEKDSIIARARLIGTEDLSAAVAEYCAIVPEHPVTAATRQELSAEWEKTDSVLLDTAVTSIRALSLGTLTLHASDALAAVATDTVPDGARIVDVREPQAFSVWHAPGAERMDVHDAMRMATEPAGKQPLLFVCEHGLLSAELAHMARSHGADASSFRGGSSALRAKIEA